MKFILAFCVFVAAVSQINAAVNVSFYYESLCIDCVNFVKNQMWPTYRDLGDNLKMDFVPFGKASWTENPWSIRCQHGDRECHGNAIQACALERYKKPEMQVKFVTCVMSDPQPDRAGAACAKKLGYSYEGIDECALGQEGRQLHMKHGRRTKAFRPPITFIPTVAFNDVYNARDQQLSMYQFKQVVCSKFPPGQKPPGCGRQGSEDELAIRENEDSREMHTSKNEFILIMKIRVATPAATRTAEPMSHQLNNSAYSGYVSSKACEAKVCECKKGFVQLYVNYVNG